MLSRIVRPDSKGRITLGHLADGVSGYVLTEKKDHTLILSPRVEIPARELWLFKNRTALKKVNRGLKDAEEGRISKKGSFAKFVDDDVE